MAWVAASAALGVAIEVVARLWSTGPTAEGAAFMSSGLVFAVYVTGCLVAGGVKRPVILVAMTLFGVTFPWWSFWLGVPLFFAGGMYGVPQAVITALVFHPATRSWIPAVGSLGGLAAGWIVQMLWRDAADLDLLIYTWHAWMLGALVWWIAAKRGFFAPLPPGVCASCGYSRDGLPLGTACPECGLRPVLG